MSPTEAGHLDLTRVGVAVEDPRRARLADYERDMERLRPEYEHAKAVAGSDDRRIVIDKAWTALVVTLAQFQPGDSGDKALFILGQCQMLVSQVQKPLSILTDYQSLRESARKLREAVR